MAWLAAEAGISLAAAEQVIAYLDESRRALGAMPTQDTLVLERFFDESGGMQLVLHAPFGSRINKAWGLALRKRFCRQFDFELQAAATDEALLLSLGPQHSFPLADVFRYLHPATARDVLDSGVPRRAGVSDALALEHDDFARRAAQPRRQESSAAAAAHAGRRPDGRGLSRRGGVSREHPGRSPVFPIIRSSGRPSATASKRRWTSTASPRVLERIQRGELRLVSRDTAEPSPLAHEIINARPYAFLDDAPLEERRTQAVQARRAGDGVDGRRSRRGSTRRRSRACATKRARIRAMPTSCTTRC